MTGERPILAIVGATGSGKSALAMLLARQSGAEILSVDSMQVYRGMDVGTAKPSVGERAQVPHHLIDCAAPDEVFNAARFVELADAVIAAARQRDVPLIATGGTPLYYKALFEGMFAGPSADEATRDRLRALGSAELHERLRRVDPEAAQRIHADDTRRLVRALEVFELTGQPISTLQTQWNSQASRHRVIWIGLKWERDGLSRRINARVGQMIASGWAKETAALLAQYPRLSKTAQEATGYSELIDHIQGRISLADAIEQIKIATRQLARRQMKWFRRFRDVHWLAGDRAVDETVKIALRVWEGNGSEL